ncbi:MAG: FkbM family methyltransferase [Anaerolineales bacterium]|nr:FkbM family methyltransferase [Anaerolineales bacterium]
MQIWNVIKKILVGLRVKARVWLWNFYGKFRDEITVFTKQGVFSVYLAKNESIGRSLYSTGQYEAELINSVPKFLADWQKEGGTQPKGTMMDIGANNGVICISMLSQRYFTRAVAVEPDPRNFSILKRNVNDNQFQEDILCLPFAVSDKAANISFELSETNFGDHRVKGVGLEGKHNEAQRKVIEVPSVPLDRLVEDLPEEIREDISLVWVDVQGHEGFVFKGAKNLIARGVPFVSEIWPYGIQRAGMTEKEFCEIVVENWKYYWVKRQGRFIKYPTEILSAFFDELGSDGNHANVIFTK